MRSQTLNGSSRPPHLDVVLRTPLTTASTRPSSRVYRRRMRSASPRGRELRTMARAFSLRTVSLRRRRSRDAAKTTRGMPARSARSCAGAKAPAAANSAPHGGGLPGPDLDGQHAAGAQASGGGRDQPAVDVEPVFAAVERQARLVLAHVRLEGAVLGRGDVRRIGDDDVEAHRARGRSSSRSPTTDVDAAAEAEARRVAARHLHGGLAHVGGHARARTGSRPPGPARCSRSRCPRRAPGARRGRGPPRRSALAAAPAPRPAPRAPRPPASRSRAAGSAPRA